MVGGNHDVRCKQWKFVIDFRSSKSSSCVRRIHAFVKWSGAKKDGCFRRLATNMLLLQFN